MANFQKLLVGTLSGFLLAGCGSTDEGKVTNLWTWFGGSNTANATGVYGSMGLAAPTNVPGARYSTATWTDTSGNLWLFGGYGRGEAGTTTGLLSDLWMYDTGTREWTWISGDKTLYSEGQWYLSPGGLANAVTWTDASGNLWLFGGQYCEGLTCGQLNELWKFDPSAHRWSSMSGPTLMNAKGVYGSKGTPDNANVPGARSGAVAWADADNLWLFGGNGCDSVSTNVALNDLWKYSLSSKQWTWMGGSNLGRASGVYGTLGTPATTNIPGARYWSVSWTDREGKFWLFGGSATDSQGKVGPTNDLWKYDPSTNEWSWEGGADTLLATNGVFGTKGVAAPTNVPPGRRGAMGWTDNNGNLWLLGGKVNDGQSNDGTLNDLWKYRPSTKQWTWVGGSDLTGASGYYGTQGAASPANMPGARWLAATWTHTSGRLWLFGGSGAADVGSAGDLNDLWEYQP